MNDNKSSALGVIATIFGLLAGVGTLVYLGGGSLLALRLTFAKAPAAALFASQISRELVVAMGLNHIVLPLVGVGLIYLGFRVVRGNAQRRLVSGKWWVTWTLVGSALLVAPGVWYEHQWRPPEGAPEAVFWPLWWWVLVVTVPPMVVVVALRLRQRLIQTKYRTDWSLNRSAAIFAMAALWTLAALPGALVLGSAAPFDYVTICSQGHSLSGLFIGQSTDRVFMAEAGRFVGRRVLSLRLEDTDAIFVGGGGGDCDNEALFAPQSTMDTPTGPEIGEP